MILLIFSTFLSTWNVEVRAIVKDLDQVNNADSALRYESSTLILYKELSSTIFQSLAGPFALCIIDPIPHNCRWRGWRRQCKFFLPV